MQDPTRIFPNPAADMVALIVFFSRVIASQGSKNMKYFEGISDFLKHVLRGVSKFLWKLMNGRL
eukprot:7485747-Lingulodinium_polyedra.AAC.1